MILTPILSFSLFVILYYNIATMYKKKKIALKKHHKKQGKTIKNLRY